MLIKNRINEKIKRFKKNKPKLLRQYRIFQTLYNDEIFNGLMLSDGSLDRILYKNSRFVLGQSYEHKDLILKTQEHFVDLNINCSVKLMFNKKSNKHWYYLYTEQNKAFTMMRKIWYPNDMKIVPNYIRITDKLLCYWFMGDGSSSWFSKCSSRIHLYTNAFPELDTIKLSKMLQEFNLESSVRKMKKNYFVIVIRKGKSVEKFYDIVEPYIVNCFKYKIKHHKIDGRILTRGMHKSPDTEFKKGIHHSPNTEFKKGHKSWNREV